MACLDKEKTKGRYKSLKGCHVEGGGGDLPSVAPKGRARMEGAALGKNMLTVKADWHWNSLLSAVVGPLSLEVCKQRLEGLSRLLSCLH